MTIQNPIVLLSTLFISFCVADAWILKGSTFQPILSSTNHNKCRQSVIVSLLSSCQETNAEVFCQENIQDCQSFSSSRRRFFDESRRFLLLPAATTLVASFPASAKYGEGTSMEVPGLGSYIDYLIDKNTGADNSNALYKGADPATILRRLAESERRLGEVGELAEKKKWSEINGLITGPLGTLSSSMSQIASIASSSTTPKKAKQVDQAVKKVKADVFAIGQAANKKNAEGCAQQAQLASNDLKILLELAFD